jgi:hypothetical protein
MSEEALAGLDRVEEVVAKGYRKQFNFLVAVCVIIGVVIGGYKLAVGFAVDHGSEELAPIVKAQAALLDSQSKQLADHESRIRNMESTVVSVDTNVKELLKRDIARNGRSENGQ